MRLIRIAIAVVILLSMNVYAFENIATRGLVALPKENGKVWMSWRFLETDLQTTGYWLALEDETVDALRRSGSWTNDPNEYGPDWGNQRQQARARDGYRCQMCGMPEGDREHDVHHKLPFRGFASYREANRLSNLVTLCSRCHRRAKAAVRMRSGLAAVSFTLGHLAPLSLMAPMSALVATAT